MSPDTVQQPPTPREPGPIRSIWRVDGRPVVAAAGATLAVVLGVYAIARAHDAIPARALVACLAAGTLWTALVCGALAAGGQGAISAVLRGGVVADAGGAALLVLWAGTSASEVGLSFLAVLTIYCTWASLALASVAAARVARRPAGRWAGAVAAAFVLSAALATPFWLSGPAGTLEGESRDRFVAICVEVNPFYSVAGVVAEKTSFVWHQSGAMYEMSRLFDYAPPPVPWYAATLWYLPLAGLLCAGHLLRVVRVKGNDSRPVGGP